MAAVVPPGIPHPVPPVVVHAVPVGNVVVHAQQLNTAMKLYLVSSDGAKIPIRMTVAQEADYNRICDRLRPNGAHNFTFDAQNLIVTANGVETQLYSDNPDVIAYREFVHEIWTDDFAWDTQLPGHRTSPSRPSSFSNASGRIKGLKFEDKDVEKTLAGKPLAADKIAYLQRDRAVKHLMKASKDVLDTVHGVVEAARPQGIQSQGRKQALLKAKEIFSDSFQATLAFEAAHKLPNDATAVQLQAKKKQVQDWIESSKSPALSTWSESVKTMSWSEPNDEVVELYYAEDLARLGCLDKPTYALLGADERAEGPAMFYARLADAVVTDDNVDEITAIINGPLFDLAFGGLCVQDRDEVRRGLLDRAVALNGALQPNDEQNERLEQCIENEDNLPAEFDAELFPQPRPNP